MALTSPGVQVTVIDESFYTPAEPGTTPLIVIATAENKSNAAGTGTAAGTTQANAGKVFKVTSQRELVDTFGVPFFEKTASSTPIHGSERNEYGLLAAYSFLGVSNSAFIMRADVNLDELVSQSTAPGAEPVDGAWWVDTLATSWGIQEWNGAPAGLTVGGQKFAVKTPIVLTDDEESKVESNAPRSAVGAIGDYAVVFQTVAGGPTAYSAARENATVWFKSAGNTYTTNDGLIDPGSWVLVGSPAWKASWPTITSSVTTALPSGTLKLNGTAVSVGSGVTRATLAAAINSVCAAQGISARAVGGGLQIYTDGEDSSQSDSSAVTKGILNVGDDSTAGVLDALGITAGDYYPPSLQQTPHTIVPTWKLSGATPRPTGSVWVKTTEPNYGARWIVKRWNSGTKTWIEYSAPIYTTTAAALYYLDRSGGGVNIAADSLFVQSNANEEAGQDSTATFKVWKKKASGSTVITSSVIVDDTFTSSDYGFNLAETLQGELALSAYTEITFNGATGEGAGVVTANRFASAINAAGLTHVVAEVTSSNQLKITHKAGGDIKIAAHNTYADPFDIFTTVNLETGDGTPNFYNAVNLASTATDLYVVSNWTPLATDGFNATSNEPLAEPQNGQLWYNTNFSEVDMLIHNGEIWVGYKDATSPYADTDANGPIVAASMPTKQSDGLPLQNGDLWISTADLENFPTIYKYNVDGGASVSERWILVDKTVQTTEEGVLFADARYGSSGATGNTEATIKELLASNYIDFDAPDPALYPKGMLLWNLRRSGGNVKRYANSYINPADKNVRYEALFNDAGDSPVLGDGQSSYEVDRWITASPNNEDGSGSFGRKAQRALVVQKLKSAIDTSEEARDEERRNFNLISCPGYPEAFQNLISLNLDRGMTAFVVGDTPLRLKSDSTSLLAYGSNANGALDNGDDGIVSYDEYSAVYYPNGFTTDLGGANAVVPASHMMLRTIALSDQVSYPWFAPAGTRRGGITNATAVGYIDAATGEFQSVALNEGQRDTLYDQKINPIPFFVGVGLVAYGQKTRARNASALDRINVARLIVYLRSQLNKLARPYIFEPNDKITRDEIKGAVESLLLELVGLRALYDFAVVCDESNNTNARIDRNELYVDIAIEPTKAVEFIYIPLRVKNTGEI